MAETKVGPGKKGMYTLKQRGIRQGQTRTKWVFLNSNGNPKQEQPGRACLSPREACSGVKQETKGRTLNSDGGPKKLENHRGIKGCVFYQNGSQREVRQETKGLSYLKLRQEFKETWESQGYKRVRISPKRALM